MIDEQSSVNKPHDRGYKDVMSNKDSFLHFLNKYIKAPWAKEITADNLERVETSNVLKDYSERESDVVYKLKDKNVYFYVLLEMQSKPDFSMPWRLLQYMVNLLAYEFKNTDEDERLQKAFKLPAIVPIVLYNGENNWTPVRSYKEYTDNYEAFGNNIVDFEYHLFDLNRFNKAEIMSTHKLLDFIFALDSSQSQTAEEFKSEYEKLGRLHNELTEDDVKTLISWFIHVILKNNVDENFEREAIAAFRKGEVDVMTYAWDRILDKERNTFKEMGIEEGERKKAFDSAREMLADNVPILKIAKYTGLPQQDIEGLRA